VIFDLGETLVDETRQWETVARAAGVPPFTLAGVIGAAIEAGFDPYAALGISRISAVDHGYVVGVEDFYPDSLPTLAVLKQAGYPVGIVANQPAGVAEQLAELDLSLDTIATSATFGVAKPDPRFFERIARDVGRAPGEIVYVGDRVDNDILPALSVGMQTVFLRRGPWGFIQARWPEAATVPYRIDSLTELPAVLRAISERA
jgi:HAD superfamily hydrolase (TIGR01662 family)